ncbi:hypothetical protein CAP35_05425 [Chitinophagaceae bacterium IBVUCB1]|nr:hypothetical protein CAP35_05425 [Chitinophagaceae bacterium IBVUCB1]
MDIRQYNIKEVITFKKTTGLFGGLSNMCAGYSLNINGVIIPSAEHIYQACRFPLFPNVQYEIIRERSPMTAKMISKKYHLATRQDWETVKVKIMRWAIQVKLYQNWDKFSRVLLETENKPIVELSHRDKYWAAVQTDANTLIGVNALGRLLMEIRDKYVIPNNRQCCIESPEIIAFLLYGNVIDTVCDEPILKELEYASFDEYSCV